MADKNLQFLDIPRADPAKAPVEARIARLPRDLRALRCRRRRPAGGALPRLRQSVLRMEVPGAQLHSQLAEAHRGGQPVRGRGALAQDQLAARRSAAASVRRTGCAKAPARSMTVWARSPSARSRSTSPTRRSSAAGSPTCRTCGRPASAWRSSAPGPRVSAAPTSWCATACSRWCSIASRASADCSPSAFRPSSSRRKWWRRAASSWRAWASSSASGCEIGADLPFERLLAEYDAVFLGMGTYTRGARRLRRRGSARRARGAALSHCQHQPRAGAAGRRGAAGEHARQARRGARRRRHRHGLQPHRHPPGRRVRSPAPTGATRLNMPGSRRDYKNSSEEGVRVPVQPPADRDRRRAAGRGREAGDDAPRARRMRAAGACRRPSPGSEQIMPADAVIVAFGFLPSPPRWFDGHDIRLHCRAAACACRPAPRGRSRPPTRRCSPAGTWCAARTWS